MDGSGVREHQFFRCLVKMLAVLLLSCLVANAQEEKKPAPKPAAKPAAKTPAKAPAKTPGGGTTGTSTAGHGPTTSTAGHGPTTNTTAGHGPTTTGGAGKPGGASTPGRPGAPGGSAAAARPGGRPTPTGMKTVRTTNGSEVHMRANGRPADVHVANRGMDIHHGLNGNRRVTVERADHSRIVAERGGRGYVQHPYMYHGREFAHRTYYYNGRAYDRFYARYPYHGIYLEGYAPAVYFAPGFYGWAYNPWRAPIAYSWGFAGNPWYGYYGVYFTPYPVYPTASLWLTDYLISTTLAAAYQAQVAAAANAQAQAAAANAPPPPSAPLTPEVKQEIAAEVQRQIALENSESQTVAQNNQPDPASSGVARMLTDNIQHVFVSGSDYDLVDSTGVECGISEGDVLQLTVPPPANATAATLVVLASKGGQECRKGVSVSVGIEDLQAMQNHMRETIDQGMGDLQAKQGTNNLPALPPSANTPPTKAPFTDGAPPPDPDVANEIAQQTKESDQAEQDVLAQASTSGAGAPAAAGENAAPAKPPVTISMGQTIDEVTGSLGAPKSIVDLGAKKIYVYPDMKITFNGGKVTDVQ